MLGVGGAGRAPFAHGATHHGGLAVAQALGDGAVVARVAGVAAKPAVDRAADVADDFVGRSVGDSVAGKAAKCAIKD